MEATGQFAGTSNSWLWQITPWSHAAGRPCTTLVSFPQDCASPSGLQQTYCPEKALQACLSGMPSILFSIVVADIIIIIIILKLGAIGRVQHNTNLQLLVTVLPLRVIMHLT